MTKPDATQGEIAHWWPEYLPGGKAALFTLWKGAIQNSQIELLLLKTGEHRVLLEGGSNARFAPSGHIVYAREGGLMAAPFDLESLELKGEPVPVLEGVMTQGTTGAAHFSLSLDGSLAYVPAPDPPKRSLVWLDRKGQSRLLTETRRAYADPRLSPDGRRLALMIWTDDGAHIWLYDLERDALTRLSSSPVEGFFPIWTPDGTRITFRSGSDIVWQAADGSDAPETLTRGTNAIVPNSWSPDGSVVAFVDIGEPFRHLASFGRG